jgi:hypothetical protein
MNASFKDSLGKPALKVGAFLVEFVSPGIGEICKAAGCDFAVLDLEHTGFTYETVKSVVKYMHAAELPLIVRIPSREYHDISRALDVGADGVMLPMVSTIEEAKSIVKSAKYYPDGMRGVAMGLAQDRFRASPIADAFRNNNARTVLALQIENRAGVEAADEIAASMASTSCGSAIGTSACPWAFRASSTIRSSGGRSSASTRRAGSTASRWPAWRSASNNRWNFITRVSTSRPTSPTSPFSRAA